MPFPSGGWIPPSFAPLVVVPLPEPSVFSWTGPGRFPVSAIVLGVGTWEGVPQTALNRYEVWLLSEPCIALVDTIYQWITITPSLPDGVSGTAYSQLLTGHGGDGGPYTFAVLAGSLPVGLSLSSGGLVSGTPNAGASLVPTSLPGATVDVEYRQQLSVVGGTAPYTFALVDDLGTLPVCMTLTTAGLITGTPYVVGSWSFTVRATYAVVSSILTIRATDGRANTGDRADIITIRGAVDRAYTFTSTS